MAYSSLSNGSSGDEVKKLQQALIDSGYDLGSTGADGIYGNKTQAAVTKYQQDNGLIVDGVAGNQTQTKLYSNANKQTTTTPAATTATEQTTAAAPVPASSYDYANDVAYQQAIAALNEVNSKTPTYAGTYDTQLADIYNQIVNRDKFSYDVNSDALYQQYAQQYQDKGRMAMMDTMGQAAALTGGYGSSYGQSVGQQQYDAYLQQLNDVVPELYQQAYQQYSDEGDKMLQQYSMIGDLRDNEYSKYQDAYNQWYAERAYAQEQADAAYTKGYNQWQNEVDTYNTNREFDFNKENADREYQLAVDQFEYSKSKGSSSGGSSSTKSALKSEAVTSFKDSVLSQKDFEKSTKEYHQVRTDSGIQKKTLYIVDGEYYSSYDDYVAAMFRQAEQKGTFDNLTDEELQTLMSSYL